MHFFCYLFERTVISMCLNDLTCFIHTVHTSIVRNLVGLVWINQGHCIPLNMIRITEFYTETLRCLYVRINFYPNGRVSVECLQGRRGKWVDDWHEQMNTAGVKTPPETGLVLCDWWVRGTYGGVGGWKLCIKACVSCWWVLGRLWNALKGWDASFILLFLYIVSLSSFLCDLKVGLAVLFSIPDLWCAVCISAKTVTVCCLLYSSR